MTGDDSPLAAALIEDLGVLVVLDKDAFVTPTNFTQVTQIPGVPSLAPTLMPSPTQKTLITKGEITDMAVLLVMVVSFSKHSGTGGVYARARCYLSIHQPPVHLLIS